MKSPNRYNAADLVRFASALLSKVGMPSDRAEAVAGILVEGDLLGHDTHGHPLSAAFGCSGSITTSVAGGHDPATDDLNAVFSASYTDAGSGNLPPLTGTDQVVIEPVAP